MKPIWKIFTIISIVTLILAYYSIFAPTLSFGNTAIKKSGISTFILGDTTPVYAVEMYCSEYKPKDGIDSSQQKILLIGDSMLEQFRWRLRDYCAENGHKMQSVIWYSSQSEWYGTTDTLKYFINKFQPTYVILILGANELFVRDIITKRTPCVKHILEQIDTLPYIWVGPPNWKEDTGINEMIISNVGSRRYYPSKNLKYKRYPDGAHPKPESAFMWCDSVAKFIMEKSKYPILMNPPTKKYSGSPNTTILQPWKQ
ncbi:MAG: SGNH/GDSL hydrolase family protein [Bacteroidales bacterium]|nr:SGNH/GDSL hydrolase family protein [Bacteroidales bacterium]